MSKAYNNPTFVQAEYTSRPSNTNGDYVPPVATGKSL